jgi:hypothetical protein
MGRAAARLLALAALLPTLIGAAPASGAGHVRQEPPTSAAGLPVVGDCFALAELQARSGTYWPAVDPVPCTEAHTFEVTETGPLPQDVDAFAFAAARCGDLDVWTAVGVNASSAGVVADPLRVEARSFAVRPASYVCGAVAVSLNGARPASLVSLTTSLERMRPRARAQLRYCSSAAGDRSPFAPAVTVPCSTQPRWQVRAWLMWSALFDDYPGRAALRGRARELCGPGAVFTVPDAEAWAAGLPRTWCYQKYPK